MLYVSSVSCSAHTSCKGVHILLFTAERGNNFFYKQSSLKEAVPQICALEKIAVLYTGLFFFYQMRNAANITGNKLVGSPVTSK